MNEKLLSKYRKRAGYSQKEVAEALNVSQGAVSSWERGRWEPDSNSLARLADLYGVSVDVLLGRTLIEPRAEWREIREQPEIFPEDEILIPLTASLRCGFGESGQPYDLIRKIPVPSSYVRRWGKNLQAIIAIGDSMSPTIIPDDILICRTGEEWEDGNVVVVNVNDSDTIKRIRRTDDGGIDLIPDNPKYEIQHYSPEDIERLQIHVLGRVMISSKEL